MGSATRSKKQLPSATVPTEADTDQVRDLSPEKMPKKRDKFANIPSKIDNRKAAKPPVPQTASKAAKKESLAPSKWLQQLIR